MVNVVVTIDPNTNVASFKIGNNPDFLGSETVTITATDTTSLKSDSQDILVKVVQGDAPVLAPLPDITIISGTLDSTISLDPYVRDDDTEVKDLIWTVTGNNNVTVDESRLSKGSDHKLILGSQPGYIGKETLIIRVTDNEGYYDSDTIVINVITLTELFLYAFPNPIEGELVSFVIYATDSLKQVPSFKITSRGVEYERVLTKIPNVFAWKGDFEFPSNESGTASAKVTATDRFDRELTTEKSISYGVSTKKNALILADNTVSLSLQKGSFFDDKTVIMVRESAEEVLGMRTENEISVSNHLKFLTGYQFGPTEAVLNKPAQLSVNLDEIVPASMDMSKAGIFRGDYYGSDFEFVARCSDDNLSGSLNMLGRYFVALDESPPELFVQGVGGEDGELLVSLDGRDFGSGIDVHTFVTVIDGVEYYGVYDEERDAVVFPMDRIDIGSGIHNVTLQVADKVGNVSDYASAEFELDAVPHIYKLNQNYPNPFNAGTTVKYQIPESGRVTVTIYSVLGQKIAMLVDEYKDAGYYSALWDGKNERGISVSSGIYICVMRSGKFGKSFKMVFLK